MVVCYVTLQPSISQPPGKTVYALLLALDGKWDEVSVSKASVCDGYGVFPRGKAAGWDQLPVPVLMPYLGVETVAQDHTSLRLLLAVLRGEFERLTLAELAKGSGRRYVRDGLCAVALDELEARSPGRKKTNADAVPLPPETALLQVAYSEGGAAGNVCYLLSDDVRELLNLGDDGKHAHLWRLLEAHASHEHAERHLATHVAHVLREEEGYVLVNAHPGLADPLAITGMINEPPAKVTPNMKMVLGYARLLRDDDPLMKQRGLRQPAAAERAWDQCVLPPVAGDLAKTPKVKAAAASAAADDGRLSERMVMYATTRKHYPPSQELTIDYGQKYRRDYPSHKHRAVEPPYRPPRDKLRPEHLLGARWPSLPGWFNPKLQPVRRPAFRLAPKTDEIVVCPDDAEVVRARKLALGVTDVPTAAAAATSPTAPSRAAAAAATPATAAVEEEEPATPATAPAAPAAKAPKANLAKAFATAAGGKKRGAPVKRGGAALLNAFPATKKARAGA